MRLALAVLVTSAMVLAAPKKKQKAPPPSPAAEAEVKKALDTAQEKVGTCVVNGAGPGSWTRVVRVKLVLNGVGQVLSLDTTLEPPHPQTRQCVEEAVRAVTFPRTHAPVVNAEREWTFRME